MVGLSEDVLGATLADISRALVLHKVVSRAELGPPGSPVEGDKYLLPASGTLTGAWTGFSHNNIAERRNNTWKERAAFKGMWCDVLDEDVQLRYSGSVWQSLFDVGDAFQYIDDIDASTNPNYPAASKGHVYRIGIAGKIGGAAGPNVEIGDMLTCRIDGTAAGDHAAVGANWTITQNNIDGAVTGPASSTPGNLPQLSGTSGKLLADSGIAMAAVAKAPNVGAGTEITIDTDGAVTLSAPAHMIDTFEDVASDDLVSVAFWAGAPADAKCEVRLADPERVIVFKHNDDTGGLVVQGGEDFTLEDKAQIVTLTKTGDRVTVSVGGGQQIGADVTYNIPTDYATLQAAIDGVTKRPRKEGVTVTLNIESGHELTAGVDLQNGDWSWLRITADDSPSEVSCVPDGSTNVLTGVSDTSGFEIGDEVYVTLGFDGPGPFEVTGKTSNTLVLDTNSDKIAGIGAGGAYVTKAVPVADGFSSEESMFRLLRARGPNLACLIDMGGLGAGTAVEITHDSSMHVEQGGGVINSSGIGIEIRGSRFFAVNTFWSGAASVGVRMEQTAIATINGSNVDNAGDDGLFISRASSVNFIGGSATGAGGDGAEVRRSLAAFTEADFSEAAENGVNTIQGALVFMRDGFADNCGQNGILAREASVVNADNVSATNAGSAGVRAQQAASVNFNNGDASGAAGYDLTTVQGAIIDATGATYSDCNPSTLNAWTRNGCITDQNVINVMAPDQLRTYRFSLADDTADSVLLPGSGAGRSFVAEICANFNGAVGKCQMRVNNPVNNPIYTGPNIAFATGELTGATGDPGSDTKLTVSTHTDGRMYVQNRLGAPVIVTITITSADFGV